VTIRPIGKQGVEHSYMASSENKNISGVGSKQATDNDVRQICVCSHCNKKIRFKAKYAGKEAKCPGCEQPIVLNPVQQYQPVEFNRTDRLTSMAGWTTSIVLHILLLLSFTGITLQTGLGTGSKERDVRIVVEDPGIPEISDVDLTSPETPTPELTVPSPTDLHGDELTEDIASDSLTSGIDDLTSSAPDVSDSTAPMEGDLGGLSLGGGGMDVPLGGWGDLGLGGSGGGAGVGTGRGGRGGFGTFFGSRVRGRNFVYVVDNSGSMTGAKLQAAKDELIKSINELTSSQKFFIIFYNSGYNPMIPIFNLVNATDENKELARSWIESIGAGGGTRPNEAMIIALQLRPDAVWLLSDGEFNERISAISTINNANMMTGVKIHTIAYYNTGQGRLDLNFIANNNRGTCTIYP
jgi:hypothetical protein